MIKRYQLDLDVAPFVVLTLDDVAVAAAIGDEHALELLDPAQRDHPITDGGQRDHVAGALRAYADGEVRALDKIEVRQPGTPFRQDAWRAMRTIEPGATASYAELAARTGRPRAVRAAATACAINAIPLIVPCHRVVRSGGGLGNYYYGTDMKRALLEFEARAMRS